MCEQTTDRRKTVKERTVHMGETGKITGWIDNTSQSVSKLESRA